MNGPTTVLTHRGLSPHQFTPMSGAPKAVQRTGAFQLFIRHLKHLDLLFGLAEDNLACRTCRPRYARVGGCVSSMHPPAKGFWPDSFSAYVANFLWGQSTYLRIGGVLVGVEKPPADFLHGCHGSLLFIPMRYTPRQMRNRRNARRLYRQRRRAEGWKVVQFYLPSTLAMEVRQAVRTRFARFKAKRQAVA